MPFFRKLTYTRVRDRPNFYPNIRTQFTIYTQFCHSIYTISCDTSLVKVLSLTRLFCRLHGDERNFIRHNSQLVRFPMWTKIYTRFGGGMVENAGSG